MSSGESESTFKPGRDDEKVFVQGQGFLADLEIAHNNDTTLQIVTDMEYDIRVKQWEQERQSWLKQMQDNSIWTMGSNTKGTKGHDTQAEIVEEQVDITNGGLTAEDLKLMITPRRVFGLDTNLLHGRHSEHKLDHSSKYKGLPHSQKAFQPDTGLASSVVVPGDSSAGRKEKHQTHEIKPKSAQDVSLSKAKANRMRKLSRLELLRFIADWDKASFTRRDLMLVEFIKNYKTKDNLYCTDQLFHCGGSLIFCRIAISMQMSFLKHRRVWHYFDSLSIFVKSLQGDRYTEEFLRLGGLGFICEVIRVENSVHADKLHACKFLVNLMKSRNGIAVKMFICDNHNFLESLIDSLTMCKDKKLITYCGLCFENLCVEATIPQVMIVTAYVMRLLPCDFNPAIQSMAFRVLQSVVRHKPSIGRKCVKPILDNLKTEDMDLLAEMSNLSLVILQTKIGTELITQLMTVGEGIQLREQFKSVFRPHMRKAGKASKDQERELRKAREKHERVKQKMGKFDHFMQQAGALFVLNRMMTEKIDFVEQFTSQGIIGLSLKTLGSCPHWEVQGQGVTMIQFLNATSIDCAISYSLMLPDKMLRMILEQPAECLRYFTSPICALLRKLGRFALRLWNRWVEKVVTPAKTVGEGGTLPDYFIGMCKMTRKINEIQMQLQDLIDNPVMESFSKSSDAKSAGQERRSIVPHEQTDAELEREFVTDVEEDDDDDDSRLYRTGKDLLYEGRQFKEFTPFLDYQSTLSEDKLDMKIDKTVVFPEASEGAELTAYEQAILQDAENKEPAKAAEGLGSGSEQKRAGGGSMNGGSLGGGEEDENEQERASSTDAGALTI